MKTERAATEPEEEDEPAAGTEAEGTSREDIRRGLRYVLTVFLIARVGITVLAVVSVALLPAFAKDQVRGIPGPVPVVGWPAPPLAPELGWDNAATSFERFDALWFLRIATSGYGVERLDDGSAAFFPGYPLAIRAVSPVLGGHPLAAALLISNLSLLAALAILYFLTRTELSEALARRVVVYAVIFPTSFFFFAPYSESQFFLLAITSLWAARRRRWWLAGLAGALAAATRNVGLLLVVPLLVEAFHQRAEDADAQADPGRADLRLVAAVGAALAVGIGTAAYLLFWHNLAGHGLAPLHHQTTWQREFSYPWETLIGATREAFKWIGVYAGGYHLLDWLIVVPGLAACAYALIKFRPVYGVYAWASLAAPLLYVFQARPFMSVPRFLLPIFPVYWALARWGERRGVHELIVAAGAVGLGVMTLLFVNWYYVF
ncbi:MAG: mannosyltransferase family protein [Actinomycetota bacterium]